MFQVPCQVVGTGGHQILQVQQQIGYLVIWCVHRNIQITYVFFFFRIFDVIIFCILVLMYPPLKCFSDYSLIVYHFWLLMMSVINSPEQACFVDHPDNM